MRLWCFSFLLGKSDYSAGQSRPCMSGGLAVRVSVSAKIVRVLMYNNATAHYATLARKETDLFIGDVHICFVIGCLDIAEITNMSGKTLTAL